MKGKTDLKFNNDKTKAVLTFLPDETGEEITESLIKNLVADKKITTGIITENIDKAADLFSEADGYIELPVAEGSKPVPQSEGLYEWSDLDIPEELQHDAERIFRIAIDPEITEKRKVRVKVKKRVQRKTKLPFGKNKEEIVEVIEEREKDFPVDINREIIQTGWAEAGTVLAEKGSPTKGESGTNVLGEKISPANYKFYPGKGITEDENEIIAEYSGFIRIGENWAEILPFEHEAWNVTLSKDKSTPMLRIQPGALLLSKPPTAEEILKKAVSFGFDEKNLINISELKRIIDETVSTEARLDNFPLTADEDSSFSISESEDKLKGFLNIKKGSGNGKPLKLNEVGAAIKKSGFSGLDYNRIKEDLLAFYKSPDLELKDYILIEGKAPEKGEDVSFSVECAMMSPKEIKDHLELIEQAYKKRGPSGIGSLEDYPVSETKSIAEIKKGSTAGIFSKTVPGEAGKDIYGKVIPGIPGTLPEVVMLENVTRRGDEIVSDIDGFLDVFEGEGVTALRVRPAESELIQVEISNNRMEAYISIAENTETPVTADEIKDTLVASGVIKGLKEDVLAKILEESSSGEKIEHVLIASGEAPVDPGTGRLKFNLEVAGGENVSIRSDGSADYKNQNRITSVTKNDLIAVIQSSSTTARDGWEVTGGSIQAKEPAPLKTEIGKGIRKQEEENGDTSLYAEVSGELIHEGDSLYINEIHMVKGDVDLKEGNIKFPGTVKISGSVTRGFYVMSGGEVQIAGGVEASLVSAAESIIIGQGVVGSGKAILRSKKDIELAFAEQATLLAVGDIKAKNSCLRCKVKCNGKLKLLGDKGHLIGGNIKATGGIEVANLGNSNGIKTEVSFGQNYLIQDKIEQEENEVEKIKSSLAKLDLGMHKLEKDNNIAQLKKARFQKVKLMKIMEKRNVRLFTLRERFEEHFPSEITVRGRLFPGVILESHGRFYEVKTEKSKVKFSFNLQTGKIEESPLKEET